MPQDLPLSTKRLRTLRDQLVEWFKLDELNDLAFDLGVRWESLTGETIDRKATSLLEHLNQQLRIPELIGRLHEVRPGIIWALDDLTEAAEPPYRGLEFYREEDAPLFFGRATLTTELVKRLLDHPLLVVVGASGSGKSSVVRAGVIPALKGGLEPLPSSLPRSQVKKEGSREWVYLTIMPTDRPLEQLALALTSDLVTASDTWAIIRDLEEDSNSVRVYILKYLERQKKPHLFLFVDQFEELFTTCKDETQRRAFIKGLLAAVDSDSPVTLAITLRADFYHYCAQYMGLRHALEEHQIYIGTPSADELREAIIEPALLRGYDLESGLADLMLRDVGDEPGGLPLLSHALLETWIRREGRTMTLGGYNEAGGARGAITRTAERVYSALNGGQQMTARHIFVELAELGEGTEDTRRRLRLDELASQTWYADDGAMVMEGLVRTRLATVDDQTIQIAHEALIREWPRLREWLDADRVGERLRRGLQNAARDWDEHDRDLSYLFDGTRLATVQEWIMANPDRLDERSAAFVAASIAEAKREETEKEETRQRELEQARALATAEVRRSRTIRQAAIGLGALAILAILAALFAFDQQTKAQQQAARADQNSRLAQNAESTAVAVAIEADEERQGAQEAKQTAEAALVATDQQAAIALSRSLAIASKKQSDGGDRTLGLLLALEASQVAVTQEAIEQLKVSSGRGIQMFVLPIEHFLLPVEYALPGEYEDRQMPKLVWSNIGQDLLILDGKSVNVWNASTNKLTRLMNADAILGVWSSDDSKLMVITSDGTISILDPENGNISMRLEHKRPIVGAAWSKDEDTIISSTVDGEVYIWSAVSGTQLASKTATGNLFSRSASCQDDLTPHSEFSDPRLQAGWDSYTGTLLCDSSGRKLIIVSDGLDSDEVNEVQIWDLESQREEVRVSSAKPFLDAYATPLQPWSERSEQIFSFQNDKLLIVNSQDESPPTELIHNGEVIGAWWSNDGTRIATIARDGPIHIWNVASAIEKASIDTYSYIMDIVLWSPTDRQIFAAAPGWPPPSVEGPLVGVWDSDNGLPMLSLPHDFSVGAASWNADGSLLMTTDHYQAVVWDVAVVEDPDHDNVTNEDVIFHACARVGRNLTWLEWQQFFSGEPYRQTCPNLPVHYTVPEGDGLTSP